MISQFEEIAKKCGKLCRGDLCFPGDIRNMFDFFEFGRQDAVYLWEILERVFTKFYGGAENFYCSFHGLLQDNLFPNKCGGYITLTNVILEELGNHLSSFFSKSECKQEENPLIKPKIISD